MWQKAVAGICVMVGAFGFGLSLCQEINSVLLHFKIGRASCRERVSVKV